MSKSEEDNLFILMASGNQEAFNTLFLNYFPKIKKFITHMLKDVVTAEDLSQDIFIKIWEQREKLSSLNSVNGYMYTMARNAVLNEIKKQNIINRYNMYESLQQEQMVSVEDELSAKEIEFLIELTVNKMPEKRRMVYELSRMEGLSNEEIGIKLNITKKTVENHLNLALKEIKKTISIALLFFA